MDKKERYNRCTKCTDTDRDKKIIGLALLKNFKKEGKEFRNGTITNPENGKVYDAKIWLDEDNSNILNVRGYMRIFNR